MTSNRPSANTPEYTQRLPSGSGFASGSEESRGTRASGGDRPSELPRHPNHGLAGDEGQTTGTAIDDDDVEAEEWTQIPGPVGEDMSDSDGDDPNVVGVQYQLPRQIREAEQEAEHQRAVLQIAPDIHRRYTEFSHLLCRETDTEDAYQHVLDGLVIAVTTAKSIRLDMNTTQDIHLDLFAFALVVHVWQIVCLRRHHGTSPPEETDVSLCLQWGAYFISAHAILQHRDVVPVAKLRSAVQYWEDRLRSEGGGNGWMEDRWAKNIPQEDQEARFHRNKTADLYLKALEEDGKTGLALCIIEQEKKGELTQLRTMTLDSPHAAREACRQLAYMLYSMDTSVLKAIIQGQLPRLAEVESGAVHRKIRDLNEKEYVQPGTYMNCICDYAGMSPTPMQWTKVCELMLRYVQNDDEFNKLAELVDQQVHPKHDWPKDLAHKGLRRYTEWRSYIENGSLYPDITHRKWVRYFVDQLKMRMQGQPYHAPLSVPVIEIGFSNDPHNRLRQHRHHESSNYLMNLAEAAFEVAYPGAFRLQQMIIYACFRPIQPWLSEIVLTQLAQGYVEGAGGFSHEVAGRSNGVSNQTVPSKIWNMFEAQVYADGRFQQEVEASIRAREQVLADAESHERAQRLQDAREDHRKNVEALKEANARLKAMRDRLYP